MLWENYTLLSTTVNSGHFGSLPVDLLFVSEELEKFIIAFVITQRKKKEIYRPLNRKYESWSVF